MRINGWMSGKIDPRGRAGRVYSSRTWSSMGKRLSLVGGEKSGDGCKLEGTNGD